MKVGRKGYRIYRLSIELLKRVIESERSPGCRYTKTTHRATVRRSRRGKWDEVGRVLS